MIDYESSVSDNTYHVDQWYPAVKYNKPINNNIVKPVINNVNDNKVNVNNKVNDNKVNNVNVIKPTTVENFVSSISYDYLFYFIILLFFVIVLRKFNKIDKNLKLIKMLLVMNNKNALN